MQIESILASFSATTLDLLFHQPSYKREYVPQQGILLFKELRQLSLLRRIGNDKSAYLFAMGDQDQRECATYSAQGATLEDELKLHWANLP